MKRKNYLLIFIVPFIFKTGCFGQGIQSSDKYLSDSLKLKDVVTKVLETYPTIKKAETAVEMAREKINLAKAAQNPFIDATGTYSRIGPVPSFDIPQFGELKLYPNDNFNASISYHQNIYDFGKTKANVQLAQGAESIAGTGVTQAKQALAINTINVFYSLVYLQNAIQIRNEQLKNLNELVSFTRKKLNTGTSTNYELLNTQVRLTSTGSRITELKSMKISQLSVMSSLLDTLVSDSALFSQSIDIEPVNTDKDELVSQALMKRDEVHAAVQKLEIARIQYNVSKASNNPSLGLFAQAGDKNGYQPDINKMTLNYSAGLSLNIPIYDGNLHKTGMSLAQSGIQDAQYDLDLIRKNVTNEVIRNYSNLKAAEDKIDQYRMQVKLADKAYSLAKVNYQAGAITDLDLLTTETNLSESRLMLLKTRIDYVLAWYKLRLSVGDKLYEF